MPPSSRGIWICASQTKLWQGIFSQTTFCQKRLKLGRTEKNLKLKVSEHESDLASWYIRHWWRSPSLMLDKVPASRLVPRWPSREFGTPRRWSPQSSHGNGAGRCAKATTQFGWRRRQGGSVWVNWLHRKNSANQKVMTNKDNNVYKKILLLI